MQTFKIKNTPTFFKNKDFQTITVRLLFPFKNVEERLALTQILPNLLDTVSEKYPTEREFTLAKQKIFILSSYAASALVGDEGYISFELAIPDTYSLKQDLLEEQFEFFSQMIYHPKVHNQAFYENEVEREVNLLQMDVQKMMEDPDGYAFLKGKELVEPNGRFAASIYNHTEQIDQITGKSLFEFYEEVITNNHPMIYVFGNVDEKKITNLCNTYLYQDSFDSYSIDVQLKHYLPITTYKNKTEDSHFQNSVYLSFYKVKDMSIEDEVLLSTVQGLLSSLSSRILYKKLRDENDLVYSAHALSFENYGILCIATFIHKDTIDFVKEKIKEALEELKKEEIISEYLDNIKNRARIGLIKMLDDKGALFRNAIVKDLGTDLTAEEHYEKLLQITPSTISQFMDRLVLDTEYFLKEGEHE